MERTKTICKYSRRYLDQKIISVMCKGNYERWLFLWLGGMVRRN